MRGELARGLQPGPAMALAPLSSFTAGDRLRAPLSAPAWLGDLGATLRPLVSVHDRVLVVPCSRAELVPGDLVVVQSPDRRTLGQVVIGAVPLALASLSGRPAPEGATLLGRILAVRRGEKARRLPAGLRPLWAATAGLLHHARTSSRLSTTVRLLRGALTARRTLGLRRLVLGEPRIRLLGPEDVDAAVAFAAAYLVLPPERVRQRLLGRWQEGGAAGGAFSRAGRLIGFAFLDEYDDEGLDIGPGWIRSVYVLPSARGMGLAQRLIEQLCRIAFTRGLPRVRAAIEHDNTPSLAAFARQGFTPVDAALNDELNRAWRAVGSVREWIIVERRP